MQCEVDGPPREPGYKARVLIPQDAEDSQEQLGLSTIVFIHHSLNQCCFSIVFCFSIGFVLLV